MVSLRNHRNVLLWLGLALSLFTLWGCNQEADASAGVTFSLPAKLPKLSQPTMIEQGVVRYQTTLPHTGTTTKLLVFMPDTQATAKRPCILIAPAGTRLFHGSTLDDGNPPEYVPYVHEGYIVVAYELDGDLSEPLRDPEIIASAKAFKEADGGLADARLALDYALATVHEIDPNRIYTAGHSSAATVALYVAEHEPRIKACIAYAPACYLEDRIGSELIDILSSKIPGYRAFVRRASPDTDMAKLTCPVFLFHADDDSNVPTEEVSRFAEALKKTNSQVTYATVPTGEHYQSMIQQGIPQAIEWLKRLPATTP